jgi:hypothetical protein
MDESLSLELSRLKLAYLTGDWLEVAAVIEWLTSRGYLNAAQVSPLGTGLNLEELRQRREYSWEAAGIGLWGLSQAYRQRDWDGINRILQWLQVRGYIG